MKKSLFILLLTVVLVLSACAQSGNGDKGGFVLCAAHADVDDDGRCDNCAISVLEKVQIYCFNDLHGKLADGDSHPGVDEMTTYFKNLREENDNVILLSAGDMWQGSAESNMTKGQIMVDWMNELDFAAMALGNHEYDWGEEYIEQNAELAEFPFVAINIYERDTNEPVSYCQPSAMVDLGDVQIGIIGAMGDCYSSIMAEKVEDVYFKVGSELTALVKAEAESLRKQGADFIVYLIHDGYGQSKSGLLTSSQLKSYYDDSLSDGYVDLVFEGHTHQRYNAEDGYGVKHLQGGGDNRAISYAEVSFNIANGNTRISSSDVVMTGAYSHLDGDSVVQDLLDKYSDEISAAEEVLGTASRDYDRDELRQIIADLYYEAGVEKWGDKYQIAAGGGYLSVRSPGYLGAGNVTYGDLQGLFTFDNELVLCSVKGSVLKSRFFETNNGDYFIGCGDYGESLKNEIDPNGTYYIVVDTYTSTYAPNKLTEIERYGEELYARDLLAEYIRDGRLK